MLVNLIESVYRLLWGDLFTLPVAGGIGISFMVVLLFAAGIGFTLRTRLLPVRLFRDMIAAVCEKNQSRDSLSSFQTLIVSTATRVGMGNLVGVVTEVGLNWCRLTTILDTGSQLGAMVFRTEETAIAAGDLSLMTEGKLKLSYLPDSSTLIKGDLVVTSGLGGYYPSGLPIGSVEEVRTDDGGLAAAAFHLRAHPVEQGRNVVRGLEILEIVHSLRSFFEICCHCSAKKRGLQWRERRNSHFIGLFRARM